MMSDMLPEFDATAVDTMLDMALQLVQTHQTLLYWLAAMILFIFVVTYLIDQVNRPNL